MSDMEIGRRPFFLRAFTAVAGAFVAPAVFGTALSAGAQEHQHGLMGHSGSEGFVMPASTKKCGTCDSWGGPRRLSKDGKNVAFTGLGWCNNTKCPGFREMMGPDHICTDGCWHMWGALG
jgi:hypothetical protein